MNEFRGVKAFLMIPVGISRDTDLLKKPKSIILAGEIFSMLNTTGRFYMSNKEIAKRLQVSVVTVVDYLNLLESKGYIHREMIKGEKGNIEKRMITAGANLIKSTSIGWLDELKGGYKDDLKGVIKPTLNKYNIEDNSEYNSNNSCASDDAGVSEKVDKSKKTKEKDTQIAKDFEEIWQVYPRKIGKKEAFRHYKAWLKQSKSNTKEVMLEKVKAFAKYILLKGTAKDYIPYGSTWFNSRVDDDYTSDADQGNQPTSGGYDNANSLLNDNDDNLPF